MVYLIGGAPRCGKTILSKRISRETGVSYISTDAIRNMILRTIPRSEIDTKFPQEKMKVADDLFRFDVYSHEDMLRAQLIESKTIWPSIKGLIAFLIDSKQEYIIEGIHIFPRFIKELKKHPNYSRSTRAVYLIKKNLQKIKQGFPKNKKEFDWMFPAIKNDPHRIEKAANMVRVKSVFIEKEAKQYRFKVFNTENNFDQDLKAAQRYLLR